MAGVSFGDVHTALGGRAPLRIAEAAHRAAVAMVLREGEGGLEVLFIKRAEHPEDPWSGQVGFPGGRVEEGDRDLTMTAVRETTEEIGVHLDRDGELMGCLDDVRAMARLRPVDLVITPFVFRLLGPVNPRLSAEVVGIHWLTVDDLVDPAHRSTLDYGYQGSTLQFPCLRVGDLVIWGLTYRMFQGFEERLPSASASAATRRE